MKQIIKTLKNRVHQHYYLKDGTEVCGVTTIIGQLDKPFLLRWAYNLAVQGIKYFEVTEKSKNIGTLVHHMIECEITDKKVKEENLNDFTIDEINSAKRSFELFKKWIFSSNHDIEIIGSEMQMVSEKHGYGGTIDMLIKLDGKLTLLDVKTGSGIYPEMTYQLSAYRQLHDENYKNKIQKVLILHINHEKLDYTEYNYELKELDYLFEGFLALLKFYIINKSLKKTYKR